MTVTTIAPKEYPTEIVTEPFELDGLRFAPHIPGQIERATRDGEIIGDVLLDRREDKNGNTIDSWFARKFDARGELTDWQPMRCAAEARAFIVSKIRP